MAEKPFSLSVKAVILDKQDRCLLIRRSSHNRSFVGKWEWPGGKVDSGENFSTAIIRETFEETSLKVSLLGLAGAAQFEMPEVHVVLLCMEAQVVGGEIKLSEEHDNYAWVPLAEISRQPVPDQVRGFMLEYAQRKERAT